MRDPWLLWRREACFTNDDHLAKTTREIRVHGQDRGYHHAPIRINGRLDTDQATVLLEKLKVFPEEVWARSGMGGRYSKLLEGAVDIPWVEPDKSSMYAQYMIGTDDRDLVQEHLKRQRYPAAMYYPILPYQPQVLSQDCDQLTVANHAAQRVTSLPVDPWLNAQDQGAVAETALARMLHDLHANTRKAPLTVHRVSFPKADATSVTSCASRLRVKYPG